MARADVAAPSPCLELGELMREEVVIAAIADAFAAAIAPGALSFSDDCAQLPSGPPGTVRVLSTDVVVEGCDFDRALYPLRYAGERALTQNLSDLAACGARPVGFLWALSLPERWLAENLADLRAFAQGAAAVARREGAPLLGGDLSGTQGPASIAITVVGDVKGTPLTRAGAREGDTIWLSRPVGLSSTGLERLRSGAALDLDDPAIAAHLCARAELELGQALVGTASACLDISDGLARDLHRLCRTSEVGARIELEPLLAAGVTAERALFGGEDYALLFTAPNQASVPKGIRIGSICSGSAVTLQTPTGERPLPERGFDHFGGDGQA